MYKNCWPFCFYGANEPYYREVDVDSCYFWKNLSCQSEKSNSIKKFALEKDFFLFEDEGKTAQSVLTIGIDPESEFSVIGYLKITPRDIAFLNAVELRNLFNFLDDQWEEIFEPEKVEFHKVQWGMSIKENHESRVFTLEMDNKKIDIDQATLKAIYRQEAAILRYISLLEHETSLCEQSFFTLLNCFYRGKTVQGSIFSTKNSDLQTFFNHVIENDCIGLKEEFVIDMITRFEKFFVKCLPLFIKTIMLKESERKLTFSEKWPYSKDYISSKNMAMSGLYFTGIDDNIKCAFCSVGIHKWMPGDDPIADHYKYSRNCSLLRNPKKTMNVLDLSSEEELDHLLSHLPKHGVDEVD